MASLSGSVDRIVFRNDDSGYCVARFQATDALGGSGATTIVGTMPEVRPGEMLRLTGLWETHPVHGRHFRVESFEEELPSTEDGIERYLSSGAIRGIGPVTAARIVEFFGADAIRVMDEEPDKLRAVQGISDRRLEIIKSSWEEQQRIRALSIFLQQHGVSVALARRIHETYGDRAEGEIKADPYRLAHDVHGIGFITADALARQLGIPRDSLSRRVAGLRYVLSASTDEGHVYLPRADLLQRAVKVLSARPEELEPALLELARRGDAVLDGDDVYLAPFFKAEAGAARLLNSLQSTPSALTLDPRLSATAVVAEAAGREGIVLAEKQLLAAEMALREKVSILTGGPGTGKTSTLRTIITALEAEQISFCLCAPTGRAAKRVAETTGRPASTIHRLLEFQPALSIFGYDNNRPLPYDFVVVDEVSMLDILLFYHLLKAIPREAHLLLVGDADQLPAVGPGCVLRDLLATETIPATELTELFRQARGSKIILAAHAINQGAVPALDNRPDCDFFFVPARTDEEAQTVIRRMITERIPRKFGLDPIADVQVLSPLHAGPLGVAALNDLLQRELNPPGRGILELPRGSRTFRPGDKVMQIRNNYEKDVYNGDVGSVVAVDPPEQRLLVTFGSGPSAAEVEYPANDLDELVLAYAVSVHKAQGSEFPCVVMPLVTKHFIMLQRHLLYTAVTRARHLCVLVGSERAMAIAAATDRREHRNTRLSQRIGRHDYAEQFELV